MMTKLWMRNVVYKNCVINKKTLNILSNFLVYFLDDTDTAYANERLKLLLDEKRELLEIIWITSIFRVQRKVDHFHESFDLDSKKLLYNSGRNTNLVSIENIFK